MKGMWSVFKENNFWYGYYLGLYSIVFNYIDYFFVVVVSLQYFGQSCIWLICLDSVCFG